MVSGVLEFFHWFLQRIEELESQVKVLQNELNLYQSNGRWEEVQQEKQVSTGHAIVLIVFFLTEIASDFHF